MEAKPQLPSRQEVLGHHAGRELIRVEGLVHSFLGQQRLEIVSVMLVVPSV